MTRHDPLDAAAELKANVSVPFERARAMPRSVYTSEAFLKREMEEIFAREWYCVGRSDQFAKPGDYIATELAGQPIMVLRDRDGALRAQSNVCRHRMSTLLEGSGNVGSIVCPYHAWTYNLDGTLRGAPGMTKNEAFDKKDICLPQIRCAEWLGWVLVTLNPEAADPAEQLRGVSDLVGDFGMEEYAQTFQEEHRWNTNWKVLAENFMESYHLPVCHGGTIGSFVKLEEMECPPGLPAFNYHWILKDPSFFLSVAHPNSTRLQGERRRMTYLISIYPSLMITLTPGYFWYLSLHPDGVDHVRILYGGGLSPDFAADPEAEAHFTATKKLLDEVNDEDKGCTEKVFRGLCSAMAEPGPLSHLERPNYDFASWIAGKLE
ncbi:MAG: aromatic ring-hydroxylating oxygenase subunit alpha [Pikeienuella sp.]|uniref:aromatic ring-hydroxylating oxygenase subunit alpha n=1 Tax=Pikeienuella sp. TaxID=2831957 RepID=UPI00391D429E